MSSPADEWDRRRSDAEWRRELAKTLEEIKDRLAALEGAKKDEADRQRHIREFFEDFGRWVGYGGKLIVSGGIIIGAIIAIVAWMAKHGG